MSGATNHVRPFVAGLLREDRKMIRPINHSNKGGVGGGVVNNSRVERGRFKIVTYSLDQSAYDSNRVDQ